MDCALLLTVVRSYDSPDREYDDVPVLGDESKKTQQGRYG